MSKIIKIVGKALLVVDSETNVVEFNVPKNYYYFEQWNLDTNQIIQFVSISKDFEIYRHIPAIALADAVDFNQNAFTATTFSLFAQRNLANESDYHEDVNKFGYNLQVDIANSEIIASFGGIYDPLTMVMNTPETFTITYNNVNDGASANGAKILQFLYLDSNFREKTAIHVLGSTGSDVTTFQGVGINRVFVVSFGTSKYNVSDITISATISATVQAQIPATTSVTQQCLYHTPINTILKLNYFIFNIVKTAGGQLPIVNIKFYSYSRITKGIYLLQNIDIDTSNENHIEKIIDKNPITVSGREVLYLEASTDQNNTKIFSRFTGNLYPL